MSNDDKLVLPCISVPSDNTSSTDVSLTIVASLAVLQDRHLETAGGIVVFGSDGQLPAKRGVGMKIAVWGIVELGGLLKGEFFFPLRDTNDNIPSSSSAPQELPCADAHCKCPGARPFQ